MSIEPNYQCRAFRAVKTANYWIGRNIARKASVPGLHSDGRWIVEMVDQPEFIWRVMIDISEDITY